MEQNPYEIGIIFSSAWELLSPMCRINLEVKLYKGLIWASTFKQISYKASVLSHNLLKDFLKTSVCPFLFPWEFQIKVYSLQVQVILLLQLIPSDG